ncbi:MAG: hypothetical protein ACLFSB_05600, partial [Chitinispirillaceae bacterium]
LLVGLPILDVSAAMARRYIRALTNGVKWTRAFGSMTVADNGHIHHRLVYRGFQHSEATLFLSFLQATFCATALIVVHAPPVFSILASFYLLVLIIWLLMRLSFLDSLERIISKKILSVSIPQGPYHIAVVDADPILKHALVTYEQHDFSFHFLNREQVFETKELAYTAIILSCTDTSSFDDDRIFAHHVAFINDCPTILVSGAEKMQLPKEKIEAQGVVLHATRPVYIPALLYELFSIAKHRSAGVAIRHNLINITKLQPITGWASNGKKFPKK